MKIRTPAARSARPLRAGLTLAAGALLGATLLSTTLAAPLAAQLRPQTTAPWLAGAGVAYESYSFGDADAIGIEGLSLLTLPFAGSARVYKDWRLSLTGAVASGTLERSTGESTTVSGLTDSYLALDVPVLRDRLSVSVIAALPTGTSSFSEEEALAAGAFASDLLPFRVTNWGSGGALGVAATAVHAAGPLSFGVSAGYSAAGEFEPLTSDEFTYRPGNELALRFAMDRTIGRSGKASLQVAAQTYGDDQLSGQNLYQSGNRYSAVASGAWATGPRASAAVYLGLMHRSEGSFLDVPGGPFAGEDVASQNLILLGGGLRMPVGQGTLVPQLDTRVFRREDGVGQGYVGGLGLGYEFAAGDALITPLVRARLGRLVALDERESGLTGLETAVTVRFGAGR